MKRFSVTNFIAINFVVSEIGTNKVTVSQFYCFISYNISIDFELESSLIAFACSFTKFGHTDTISRTFD